MTNLMISLPEERKAFVEAEMVQLVRPRSTLSVQGFLLGLFPIMNARRFDTLSA